MPSARRSARSGRTSGRSGAERVSSSDRRSANESGRNQRRKPESKTGLYAGLGGGGAVLFIILIIALSSSGGGGGGRYSSRGRGKPAPVKSSPPPMIRDWYQVGANAGSSWKYRMRNKPTRPSREDVTMVAERMAVTQRNISKEGEKVFVKGFVETACAQ
jgi:hypothetical protein